MTNTKPVGDPYVFYTQEWLNDTYRGKTGYTEIPENGKTGWTTVYALLHALQIELGITATADNFGPSTIAKFNEKYPNGIKQQESGDTTKKNIYGIIQGGLLCKGYAIGANGPTCNFFGGTGSAIKKLKNDAGIDASSSTVTLNIMKALMSMDYFYSYDTSTKTKNIQKIQRYLNANYEDYIGLSPCDGVYGRSTNKALIYALQAEEGMPTSVANGNFGPSTKGCCPTIPYNNAESNYSGTKYSENQIGRFAKLANMGLYVNGVGDGDFSTTLNTTLVKQFQNKYALPVTGILNLTTWMSIFVSSGDTSRSAKACDCATILTAAKAKTLYDNGYRYVGRYLSGTIVGGASKALSREELQIAFNAGLRVFPIQQASANKVSYFTEEQAVEDANSAYQHATNLGIPSGTIIYFAVDCDPQDTEITSNILPYFKKVYETMLSKKYRVGIYGTRNVCTRVSNKGYVISSFVSDMSTGFSGNLGFTIPNNWAFDQFATITVGSGAGQIEIDKDGFSGRDVGFGVIVPDGSTELPDDPNKKDIMNVFYSLSDVYQLALNYTGNDIHESNLLILEYLRELKGGDYGSSGTYGTKWDLMAGEIDGVFCSKVASDLGNINFNFNDPVENVPYDILHMAATLNALLYPIVSEDLELFDDVADHFAGWAGDVVTFGEDIYENGNSQEWANNNICSKTTISNFDMVDYIGDADAVVISQMLKNDSNLTFPEAFYQYFLVEDVNTNKVYVATRTNRFMDAMGTYNQFLLDANMYMTSDTFPYPLLRNQVKKEHTQQEHIDKAFIAFAIFVGNKLNEERV